MAHPSQFLTRLRSASRWLPTLVACLSWAAMIVVVASMLGLRRAAVPVLVGAAGLAINLLVRAWADERRWARPIRHLVGRLAALADKPHESLELSSVPELEELHRALRGLRKAWLSVPPQSSAPSYHLGMDSGEFGALAIDDSRTRSGLLAALPPPEGDGGAEGPSSGIFPTADMVSRLDPKNFRWLDSSPAEQEFLGCELKRLREMSFLEIVHPDDYHRAKEQLRTALEKGEIHGLIVRIRTAHGKRAIEMNVGARYGPDLTVNHLRCHVTDVTAKLRAERELKLRTRELTQVNEQLRQINRELEELKDRYRDLYQNAPAMYYSLDARGRVLECNETMLRTLGYRREEVVGHSILRVVHGPFRDTVAARLAKLHHEGTFEGDSQWAKANGELIDVWITATAIRGQDGQFVRSRTVAQDVTARHRLEAELQEKNDRLARANEELSRRNKEMDEFTYVVSHDLQEPLRTLIAFSDFLLRDYGDRLDANGQEYVRYLVEASRRLRALIQDLLDLARAGMVTGDFAPVNLDEVVSVVKADLSELIRTRGAEVRASGPLPTVWGDRDRIGQLMANLITNGLKYNTKPDPWVEVAARPDDPEEPGWATIAVRDNGIGIDPQFHAKVFQLFRRLHTREEYEGTGAGLAICSKIVQAHGGRIWVESQPDQGATFLFTLRRAQPETPATPDRATHAP
jgi:PAS domain S-box-containing protein